MNLVRCERGEFSLPGLLMAMVLFAGVLGATLVVFQTFERVNRDAEQRNDAQDRSRIASDRMARELRNLASPTQNRPESVDRATAYDLIFQSVDPIGPNTGANAANVMRVRYCLSTSATNATLWRQEQRWTTENPPAAPASASCPAAGWSSQATAVDHVVNRRDGLDRPVFSFNGATNTVDVSSVRTSLFIDLSTVQTPSETRLASGVYLRNQNRRPVAAFETPKVTPAGIVLNGSLSSDPEGGAMKFQWYKDGDKIGEGITLTWRPPAAGTYNLSLRVYDPANLEGVAATVAVPWVG